MYESAKESKYSTTEVLTGSGRVPERSAGSMTCMGRVGATKLLASVVDGKHPLNACAFGVATAFPLRDFGDKGGLLGDATAEALTDHHADLDLNHVEPARVLGREVTVRI